MASSEAKYEHSSSLLIRILQAATVLYYITTVIIFSLCCPFIYIALFHTKFYYIPLLYIPWFIFDLNSCNRGGRRWEWYRNLKMWTYFRDYFPVKMIKTCDLPPTKNYLLCYHPHGITCVGAFACFATEATNFKKEFPGLTSRILSSWIFFLMPFHRDHAMSVGSCPASKESIEWLLSKKRTGNASCLIVGGAVEMLDAHPGTATLFLKKRKGFIKLALKHGASLVPVFAFGENDIFQQVHTSRGSFLRKIQEKISRVMEFPFPLFHGIWGTPLPFRKPIYVVIGKPIDLVEEVNPSQDRIDTVHELYVQELKNLFEEHKSKYDPDLELNFI